MNSGASGAVTLTATKFRLFSTGRPSATRSEIRRSPPCFVGQRGLIFVTSGFARFNVAVQHCG